jgi:hypothetical protein
MEGKEFSHIRFYRLPSPRVAEDFLQKIRMNPDFLIGNSEQ